jgi:Concanavalin A-like lectin/glucanases superfamily/Secretion system C-terminal sorting domain
MQKRIYFCVLNFKNNDMKKIYSLIISCAGFALLNPANSVAQQNALDFDNANDQVVATGASSLIAGSSNISLTMWVYPRNPAPAFPDFDGIAGFRNNLDADFYILHYTPTSVEARFRNSAGTAYDVIGTGIQLNTWQHLAFTYDGTNLNLYFNGQLNASLPATGSIASATEDFYIGNLLYQGTNYLLNGKVDETSLWNRTLSAAEVDCIYRNGVNVADTDLKLLYDFNEGIAGGNNASVSTLPDLKQNIDGQLLNFALNGTTSNWVAGQNNFVTTNDTVCQGDSVLFGGQYYSAAGTYTQSFPISTSCDSMVILNLAIRSFNTNLLQSGANINALQGGAIYQWVDCNNSFASIAGATSQNFTATFNGSYAVVITLGGCSDTSNCVNVTTLAISQNEFSSLASVYPNPSKETFNLNFIGIEKNIQVEVCDVTGKILYSQYFDAVKTTAINAEKWSQGVYVVKIKGENKTALKRVVKL